jgi:hypothetical protein
VWWIVEKRINGTVLAGNRKQAYKEGVVDNVEENKWDEQWTEGQLATDV